MIKKIWKYPIEIIDKQLIRMPKGATLLHVGLDPNDIPCIWALINPDAPLVDRNIFIHGSGHTVIRFDEGSYVGTFVQGYFVWHVFQ